MILPNGLIDSMTITTSSSQVHLTRHRWVRTQEQDLCRPQVTILILKDIHNINKALTILSGIAGPQFAVLVLDGEGIFAAELGEMLTNPVLHFADEEVYFMQSLSSKLDFAEKFALCLMDVLFVLRVVGEGMLGSGRSERGT